MLEYSLKQMLYDALFENVVTGLSIMKSLVSHTTKFLFRPMRLGSLQSF